MDDFECNTNNTISLSNTSENIISNIGHIEKIKLCLLNDEFILYSL